MASAKQSYKSLLQKIEKIKTSGSYDLSMEEDLSIAVMNLISLEEHFYFTAEKTGKSDYLDLLKETREIRKEMMGRLIDQHEGETWCISKHLLSATMRLIEVGTKLQADGQTKQAKDTFDSAYRCYTLFWGLRLKLIDLSRVKQKPLDNNAKLEDIVNHLIDCCKE